MQSEDFDNKVRDAAEHHHPAYDDQAWMKMEKLLDKHMPVEKERKRRFLLILFFFLLLGGGAFIWWGSGNLGKSGSNLSNTTNGNKIAENKSDNELKNDKTRSTVSDTREDQKTKDEIVQKQEEKIIQPGKNDELSRAKKDKDKQPGKTRVNTNRSLIAKTNRDADPLLTSKLKVEDPIVKAIMPERDKSIGNDNKKNDLSLSKNNDLKIEKESLHNSPFASIDSLNLAEMNKPPITKLSRKKGVLFLAASVAPDLSIVGLNETGKVKTAYGFGLGYTKGRITVRSGLYVARKVYEAYPEDYKAPSAFYSRYPNLQEIKADCKVYEIPLLVSYNLKRSGTSPWFLTAGISSYLMKRETYDYYYKWNISDPVVHRERTITNANQHYFSVTTFSAGYQKALSKKISLIAEPYVKVPLTGIGFGKVKLNSAGVLVSVAYKPFGSKNRK